MSRSWRPLAWPTTVFLLLLSAPALRADLRIAQSQLNAGEVHSGAPLSQRFVFLNTGHETIEITGVQGSCGCLTPRLTRRTLKPGEEGAVLLEVNTLQQAAGPHNWRVKVLYQAGDECHKATLVLNATIIAEITVQPAALTVFADSAVAHEIVVSDLRSHPFTITAAKPSSSELRAHLTEPHRDADGHWTWRIKLEVTGDLLEGRHSETVDLFTDDPTYSHLKVPVMVVKRSRQRVTALPDSVSLNVRAAEPIPSRLGHHRRQAPWQRANTNQSADASGLDDSRVVQLRVKVSLRLRLTPNRASSYNTSAQCSDRNNNDRVTLI